MTVKNEKTSGTKSSTDSMSHRSNKKSNPGNFANDRERAAEAGRKGGKS